MRRDTNENSLGERVLELARQSDTPRKLQLEQGDAKSLRQAIDRLTGCGVAVSVIGARDSHPVLILKSASETFASLERCVTVPIRSPKMTAGFEQAYAHTLFEQWLLSNPLAVHIPKLTETPWRDEQPETADCLKFYPYCELATREEVKLAPRPVVARSEPPKPAGWNTRHTFKTIEEANAYYATR